MSQSTTPAAVISALMATYGGEPLTPVNLPVSPGYYFTLSNPTRTFCIPPVPVTTPATDPTAWATACIAAAALTRSS
jgi:hypothetical protein